jgi:hypothetical protein
MGGRECRIASKGILERKGESFDGDGDGDDDDEVDVVFEVKVKSDRCSTMELLTDVSLEINERIPRSSLCLAPPRAGEENGKTRDLR